MKRRIAQLTGLGVAVMLTVVHIRVAVQGLDYSGPLLLLDHLFDLAAVLSIVGLGAAVGRLVLSRAGFQGGDPAERLLLDVALGLGVLGAAILTLGLLSGLYAWSLVGLLVVAAILSRAEIRQLPAALREIMEFVWRNGGGRSEVAFGTLVLAAAAIFLLILSLGPPVDWDALMYHLQVPAQFLEERRVYLPEDNLHVAFVGLVHMLYLPLLALGSASGPAILNAVMAMVLGLAAFSFSARFLCGSTGSTALAAVWGTGSVLLVAITPRVDVTLAFFLFMSHYTLVRALSDAGARRSYLLITAVLFGLALAVKYQAVAYILALCPFVLWAVWKQARAALRAGRLLGALVAVGIVVAGPWLLKNLLLLGAPLYPFLADRLLEPWLAGLYGTSTIPSSVNPEIFGALRTVRQPFNVLDAFFSPGRLTVETEGAFYYASPMFFLLVFWPLVWRDRVINYLLLPAIGYLLIIILPFGITNLRYLIPAVVPLSVAASYILVRFCQRLFPRRAASVVLVVITALALFPSGRTGYLWLTRTESLGYMAGVIPGNEYMKSHIDPVVQIYGRLVEFINDSVPSEARMLMLFDARGYYLDRDVLQDNRLTNWPLIVPHLSEDECLTSLGASHVILGLGVLRAYISRGMDPNVMRLSEFDRFARRCLEPVYRGPGFVTFRSREESLRPGGETDSLRTSSPGPGNSGPVTPRH